MDERQLRSLVREVVERHLGHPAPERGRESFSLRTVEKDPRPLSVHASHILLKVIPGSETEDGLCVIEPAVRCSHCGFCQSYGH